MKIEAFLEEVVTLTIKRRGEEYFEQGAILDLEQWNVNNWQATVEGNYGNYDVDICIDSKREVKSYTCNCPYDGEVCKHVVAVLMAIDKELNTKPKTVKKKIIIPEIIDKVDEDLLRHFVKDYAKTNKEFRQLIEIKLSGNVKKNTALDYRIMVHKSLEMFSLYDYSSYNDVSDVMLQVNSIVEQALECLKKGDFINAFDIATVVIEEMMNCVEFVDDSSGLYWETIGEAFDVLVSVLYAKEANEEVKSEIHTWCMRIMIDTDYYSYCYEDELTSLSLAATKSPEQFDAMHCMLDDHIKLLRAEQKKVDSYEIENFLSFKMKLYKKEGKEKEIDRLIDDNMIMPEYRQIRVSEYLKQKAYDKAIQLLKEGVLLCEENPRSARKWQEQLMKIYQMTGDKLKLRKEAKSLFFNANFAVEYYRMYKTTFDSEEWPAECETIIMQMRPKYSLSFYNPYSSALASVFVEEKMWSHLLEIVQGANNMSVVVEHTEHLSATYADELIALYKKGIIRIAQNTGRNIYKQLALYLRKMAKLEGGSIRAAELKYYLLKTYKNRSAMKDELQSIF